MTLHRYLLWFAGAYVGIGLVAALVSTFVDAGSYISMIAPMFAAQIAGDRFVRDHLRVPNREERRALIWWSMGIAMAVTVVVALVILAADSGLVSAITENGGVMIAVGIGLLIGIVLTYLLIWFGYGRLTTRTLAGYQKRAARKQAVGR